MAGLAYDSAGAARAVRSSNGTLTDLDPLHAPYSGAYGINDAGHVVGWWASDTTSARAFLYREGSAEDLGTILGGYFAQASAITNSGRIAGFAALPDKRERAFVLDRGEVIILATLPEDGDCSAWAIIESGEVLGESVAEGGAIHAVLWDSQGAIHDLGTLAGRRDSHGYGLNNNGHCVGSSLTLGAGDDCAFLYDGTAMIDLNTLLPLGTGWLLQAAFGINDGGHIAGAGFINGQAHGFLMSPALLPAELTGATRQSLAAGRSLSRQSMHQ